MGNPDDFGWCATGNRPAYPTLQILWVNMVSSVALTVPLAFEPSSKGVMRSSPRNPNESLLSGSSRHLAISVFNLIVIFGLFEWIQQTTAQFIATMAVNALVASETFYLLSISQFVPTVFANRRDKLNRLAIPAIGIICVVILQMVFFTGGAS